MTKYNFNRRDEHVLTECFSSLFIVVFVGALIKPLCGSLGIRLFGYNGVGDDIVAAFVTKVKCR